MSSGHAFSFENSLRSANVLFVVVLTAATFFAYQPAWHGTPIMDDDQYLVGTASKSLQGLVKLWTAPERTQQYHPLVNTVFWIGKQIWGDAMLGYHFVNIGLHTGCALLLWRILKRLTVPGAALAAVIFALHPVQVESVAWMAEIKNTLSGFFFFLAFVVYLRFDEGRGSRNYALTLILFCLGLLAKTIVAMFPVAMLIALWWKRGTLRWKEDVRPLTPFVFIAGLAGIATSWMERQFSGATGELFAFSAIERLLIAGRAFWFYVGKLFWPVDMSLIYPRWHMDARLWQQYLFPLAAIALICTAWLLRNTVRWPLAAVLFFTALLFPFLGFFNVHFFNFSFAADHFQYLASVGIIAPAAAGIEISLKRFRSARQVSLCIVYAMAAFLGFLTWKQAHMYRDAEICNRDILARNPGAWAASQNLGNILLQRGEVDEAIVHLRNAIALSPPESSIAEAAHVNMGNALLHKRLPNEAVIHFQAALRLHPDATVYNSLGSALHQQGKFAEAIEAYEKALEQSTQSASALNNLAWLLATGPDASLRDGRKALELVRRACSLAPAESPVYLRTLAAAFAETGQFADAIDTAERAMFVANQNGQSGFSNVVRHELNLYKAGLPCRERTRD